MAEAQELRGRTTKPAITFRVTRLQNLALSAVVERCVLSDPDIEAVRRILGQVALADSARRLTGEQPVRIVLYADEAARVARAVSAARDAYSAHGALNWTGGRRQKSATLKVLRDRIIGALPYPYSYIAPESEAR